MEAVEARDYFNTILNNLLDQKQHRSLIVLDFILLYRINVHHLKHDMHR